MEVWEDFHAIVWRYRYLECVFGAYHGYWTSSLLAGGWAVARSRRKFPRQFKTEAVQSLMETGGPVAEVARELQIHNGTLSNWVNQWKGAKPEPESVLSRCSVYAWLRWKTRPAGGE